LGKQEDGPFRGNPKIPERLNTVIRKNAQTPKEGGPQ